jgi:hypothetical protein
VGVSHTQKYHIPTLTLGIAYTKLPRGATADDSPVVVVKKARREHGLLVSRRCTLVCGALGSGKETSIALALPVALAVCEAIVM